MRGELLDRRVEIDVAHRHRRDVQPLADLRAEARHQQRMRAEVLEEVVGDRDAVDLHDVAERAHQRLPRSASAGRRNCRCRPPCAAPWAAGSVLAVGLVAGRHRDDVEALEIGRHHVGRQMLAQLLGDFAVRQVLRALLERRSRRRARPRPARARRRSPRPARCAASAPAPTRSRSARCDSRGS